MLVSCDITNVLKCLQVFKVLSSTSTKCLPHACSEVILTFQPSFFCFICIACIYIPYPFYYLKILIIPIIGGKRVSNSYFGVGQSPVYMFSLSCQYNSPNLSSCSKYWHLPSCNNYQEAGVICEGKTRKY